MRGQIEGCDLCRHGCGVKESLRHFIYQCPKVKSQRDSLKDILQKARVGFTLKHIFTHPDARKSVEIMIGVFLGVFDDLRLDP